MKKTIAVLPGDGVGKEVTDEAVKVLKEVANTFEHEFIFEYGVIGGAAIDLYDHPFPKETEDLCKSADAVLFGAVGDPKFEEVQIKPERGLLKMRNALGLYANVRPIISYPSIYDKSPLKNELLEKVNFVVFRELTGGSDAGRPSGISEDGEQAYDMTMYTKTEIERIGHLAFQASMERKKRLTLVDKYNVLATSKLWRKTIGDLANEYPEVRVDYMYVDHAAIKLITEPASFDVILTENMFGDILTDEAAAIAGSLGLVASASLGEEHKLFEPIHGSVPELKGKNEVNPLGSILSTAMMLDIAFGLKGESQVVVNAVNEAINCGFVTKDINKEKNYTTSQVGDAIVAMINSDKMIDFNTVTII